MPQTRDTANLDDILDAVVARIRDQVTELADISCCYFALNPDSVPAISPGEFVCVVSPSSGQFDQAMIEGGGNEQLTADSQIIVKIHTFARLDEAGKSGIWFSDQTVGLMRTVRRVVKALSGYTPQTVTNLYTRDPLFPVSWAITEDAKDGHGGFEMVFGNKFDWDNDSTDLAYS